MYPLIEYKPKRETWNKGKITDQKPPQKPQQTWAIRTRLQMDNYIRDLALFNLAIDSKLRGCDLVQRRVRDVAQGGRVQSRAQIIQQKTRHPVQFEITSQTRQSVQLWFKTRSLKPSDYLFPSKNIESQHLSTRRYSRIVSCWVSLIELDPAVYRTHSLRRTKAAIIYRKTKNLRAVQLLLGHTKLESTIRYLGIEVDDALEIAEQTEI